ncbi:response regulator [Rhodopseudomonas pseudopalustris]|uniref:response regulator transcription factor n=1 Tax=Rhodopseudomonas pseudopalustris TaxID=1513892 RepID=UPI003F9ABB86
MSDDSHDAGRDQPVVYIVDDERAVRESLEDLLASVSLRTRSFASVQDFLNFELIDAPSCLVLDVRMPGQSGMEFLGNLAQLGLRLPTIVITGHGDIAMGVRAMKYGAIEFLTKPFRDQDLLDAINQGIGADRVRRAKDAAVSELKERWQTLSAGEQDVMKRVVRGLLNKQIAADLDVSEITVKVRRSHLMRKMGAKTLADLIRFYDQIHG